MVYDHPKDYGTTDMPEWVWVQRDLGLMCDAEVHMLLGTWYGYPPCCIDAFIFEETGDIATCDMVGTYYHCKKCYETKKVWNKIRNTVSNTIKGDRNEK